MYRNVVSSLARKGFLAAVILLCPHVLHAASVSLAWDRAASHTNLSSFVLKYGVTSGSYTGKVVVATNVTTATVNTLVAGVRYYFAVTAKNVAGLESDPSNEISFTPASTAPNVLPTLNLLSNVAVAEDSPQQSVALTGISSGVGDLLQTLSVSATSSNPSLIPTPTVSYTSPNTTGTLRFTPVANASGTSTITVRVNDGGLLNNLLSRTFVVTVNAVNDPPTLNGLGNLSLNANVGQQTVSLSGIGSGAANESQALTVTATSSNPSLIPTPTVSYSSPGTTGTLRFTPVANATGSATITVRVNDGQAQNNLVTRTFVVTVSGAANRPPTLNAIANVAVNEDAGSQTINLAGIGSGATTEVQALTVTATSSNPALIPTPTVSYTSPNTTGTLRFTPVANASGTSTITVRVNDGQTQNNTITRSFVVTVNAVNDVPTLNPLSSFSLNMNSGQRSVSLTGIGSGASNEAQTLKVTAASSNRGLIPDPVVTYTSPGTMGSIRFTPVANATGTSTITVTVTDGQTQNGFVTRSFVVTIVGTAPQTLYVQAEAGSRTLPMTLGVDGGAANGWHVYSTIANQGTVSLPFTASETASYYVWCRVMAPDNGRDSFFFKVDNGVEEIFPTAPQGNWSASWQWVRLNSGGVTKVLPLSQGSHTLVFRCREAFSYLDAVCITSDPGFTPSASGGVTLAAAGASAQLADDEIPEALVDSIAPVISGLEVTGADARSITLRWHTDEPVRSRADYGTNALLSDGSLVNSNFTTEHLVSLPRLQPDTAYLVQIHAVDAAGNSAMTEIGRASTAPLAVVSRSAEEGTLTPPLRTWSSREAFGELCVAGTSDGGSIEFPVQTDVPSDYILWCRLRSPVQDDWAFKLTIDGEELELLPNTGQRTGFAWCWVSLMKRPLSLGAGLHEVRLDSIPTGLALDELFFTNDPEWRPTEALD